MKLPEVEWLEPQPAEIPPELEAAVGSPLLAELLARRGLTDLQSVRAFLDPDIYTPADPLELPDLDAAADRLSLALQRGERIGVWGDFDVDGQTSTALFVSGLRSLGGDVIYHIPVRARESHGINQPNLVKMLESGAQLILTCDTGVTSHEAADFLRSRHIDLLITDHHSLPEELPKAPAVVNPQRLPADHPLRPLCGVGTASQLLRELLRRNDRADEWRTYLDLVALGTVADLASLTGDNRWLVQQGLRLLRSAPRPGLKLIMDRAELSPANLSEEHIGFILAPRMNAVGRLSDSNPLVELLTAADPASLKPVVDEMESLNSRRKRLCDDVFRAAQSLVERNPSMLDTSVLVLDHPTWPAGVVGIVASRLVELYARPVALIASPPGEPARASARSVEGVDITAALRENSGLLLGFGGHPMAAGFSILPEKITEFRRALSRSVQRQSAGRVQVNRLQVDAWLPLDQVSLDLVERLDALSPFGPGNPPPVFAARNLRLQSAMGLGRSGEHLQLTVQDEKDHLARVIWWGAAGNPLPAGRFDLAYTLRASNYKGQVDVSLEWLSARVLEESSAAEISPISFAVSDQRQVTDPTLLMPELDLDPDTLTWWEVDCPPDLPGLNRLKLRPANTLLVASIPPNREVLETALQAVHPQRVILFGHVPPTLEREFLLRRLGGLMNHIMARKDGKTSTGELAAACAVTNGIIRLGLENWQAQGWVSLQWQEDDAVQISRGGVPDHSRLPSIETKLAVLLDEQKAFHDYYRRAPLDALLGI